MEQKEAYVGFPPLPDKDEIAARLVHDPPDVRWRLVRDIFRIKSPEDRQYLVEKLQPLVNEDMADFRIKYRIMLALKALHQPDGERGGHSLVKGKGAFADETVQAAHGAPSFPAHFPVVDFHIHPKYPDFKFFMDLKEAGVTHAVILATDTDPEDMDRPEIWNQIKSRYEQAAQANHVPFERMAKHIRASLYSPTHVTNQDVADWVADYPDILFGFGSVNLSKDAGYVEKKLDELRRLNMRGVKLLPYSQFFNPAENENMPLLMEYCNDNGSIILSHCGCGAGPFEILELSRDSHPDHWAPMLKKYPEVPLVLAHAGAYSSEIPGIWLYDVLKLGKKYKNLYADLAAADWILDREMVVREIRKTMGFDRILLGTDYPLPMTAGQSLAYIVSKIKANTFLTEKEKRKILGGNAARLLGIQ